MDNGQPEDDAEAPTRYRCMQCGNLTRFEVTITRQTREFHHYTIGGERIIEDIELLEETVEPVVCRWCGASANVVEIKNDPSLSPVQSVD